MNYLLPLALQGYNLCSVNLEEEVGPHIGICTYISTNLRKSFPLATSITTLSIAMRLLYDLCRTPNAG